jgi:heterodisulfide reductase subunit A
LRDGKTKPTAVGIIHCVGSRDRNFNNYCSAICCMQSLKFAHIVQERTGATVYNFYIDIRTPSKDYDEFYQRVLEEGTLFIRGKVARSPVPRTP